MDRLLYIIIFFIFFYKFTLITLLVSLGLYIVFYIKRKNAIHTLSMEQPLRPQSGDILLFFSNRIVDPIHSLIYDGILNLPTWYPIRHYAVAINEEYYVEARHPTVFKWDNFTRKVTNTVRLAKIKHIQKDWNQGPVFVIRTDRSITEQNYKKIKINSIEKGYWNVGGCLGIVNKCFKIMNDKHTPCFTPEQFMRRYGKKIGPLII